MAEELKQIDELVGNKEKKKIQQEWLRDADESLRQMFEKYEMEVDAPEDNLEIIGDTQHIMSENFNTLKGKLISEFETRWSELNIKLTTNTKEDDLQNLKVACVRCLNKEINDLEQSPEYENFQTMIYFRKEKNTRTFTARSGRKEKINLSVDYFFKCEVCNHKMCISIEEEQ